MSQNQGPAYLSNFMIVSDPQKKLFLQTDFGGVLLETRYWDVHSYFVNGL